jgi:hypothetical protein
MRDPRRAVLAATLIAGACAHGDGMKPAVAAVQPVALAPAALAPDAARAAVAPEPPGVEFARDVRPILETRCQPCHFPGGVMYGKLPFDREATIHALGEKLFTRIKAADEQRTIRDLLAQTR